MTKMKKLLALVFCALIIVPMIYTPKVSAATAGWVQNGSYWEYYKADGSKAVSEWVKSGTKWYYINQYGYMLSDGDYMIPNSKGENEWYYFGKSGAMLTNYWNDCGSYWEYLH